MREKSLVVVFGSAPRARWHQRWNVYLWMGSILAADGDCRLLVEY